MTDFDDTFFRDHLGCARLHLRQRPKVLIAASGGSDSQSLIHLLAKEHGENPFGDLAVAGVDHGLRNDAVSELSLAKSLCGSLGLSWYQTTLSLPRTGNLLANARKARYQALRTLLAALNFDYIVLGHTATDQLETILLHLTQGCGLPGAQGMAGVTNDLWRPLLFAPRQSLMDYLNRHHIEYASDPSNTDPRYRRIHIRHQVLPQLQQINPKVEQAFGRFSEIARIDNEALEEIAKDRLDSALGPLASLDLSPLNKQPTALLRRIIKQWLKQHDLRCNHKQLVFICEGVSHGKLSTTLDRRIIIIDRDRLWCAPKHDRYEIPLKRSGSTAVPHVQWNIFSHEETISATILDTYEKNKKNSENRGEIVAFDADELHFPMSVRSWQPGDRIFLQSDTKETLISELFTQHKVPKMLRLQWPLLVEGPAFKKLEETYGSKSGERCSDQNSESSRQMVEESNTRETHAAPLGKVLWVIGIANARSNFAPVRPHTRHSLTLYCKRSPKDLVALQMNNGTTY